MTSPTGPDRDRLRASDAGQEAPDLMANLRRSLERPAPQQPPAQERECTCVPHPYGAGIERDCPVHGEPSEADSAGEDEAELDAATAWVSHHVSPAIGWWRLADSESKTFDHQLMQDRYRAAAAQVLAMRPRASSGVRGGDDQARERLAVVLDGVTDERSRQDAKWGEQNHPDGTGDHWDALTGRHAGASVEMAEDAQRRTDEAAERGQCTWSLILAEEVAEALAEEDPAKLRTELIQVAAVATQWVEAIDRRRAARLSAGRPEGAR